MQTIFKLATVIFIGLIISYGTDKKFDASSNSGLRIIDNSYILTNSQKDSIETLINKLDQEIGLENIIKDEIAARIIRDDMAPLFRQEKYGQGIYLAVDRISKLIVENKELVGTQPR